MKVKFYCDSGANIGSCTEEIFDLEKDLGITDEEWQSMSDDEKYKEAEEWAWNNGLEIGWEELE